MQKKIVREQTIAGEHELLRGNAKLLMVNKLLWGNKRLERVQIIVRERELEKARKILREHKTTAWERKSILREWKTIAREQRILKGNIK